MVTLLKSYLYLDTWKFETIHGHQVFGHLTWTPTIFKGFCCFSGSDGQMPAWAQWWWWLCYHSKHCSSLFWQTPLPKLPNSWASVKGFIWQTSSENHPDRLSAQNVHPESVHKIFALLGDFFLLLWFKIGQHLFSWLLWLLTMGRWIEPLQLVVSAQEEARW